jgi:hypothetical protein
LQSFSRDAPPRFSSPAELPAAVFRAAIGLPVTMMAVGKVEQGHERPVVAQHHWIVRICIFVNPNPLHQETIREGGASSSMARCLGCGNFATGEKFESMRQILHSELRAPDAI